MPGVHLLQIVPPFLRAFPGAARKFLVRLILVIQTQNDSVLVALAGPLPQAQQNPVVAVLAGHLGQVPVRKPADVRCQKRLIRGLAVVQFPDGIQTALLPQLIRQSRVDAVHMAFGIMPFQHVRQAENRQTGFLPLAVQIHMQFGFIIYRRRQFLPLAAGNEPVGIQPCPEGIHGPDDFLRHRLLALPLVGLRPDQHTVVQGFVRHQAERDYVVRHVCPRRGQINRFPGIHTPTQLGQIQILIIRHGVPGLLQQGPELRVNLLPGLRLIRVIQAANLLKPGPVAGQHRPPAGIGVPHVPDIDPGRIAPHVPPDLLNHPHRVPETALHGRRARHPQDHVISDLSRFLPGQQLFQPLPGLVFPVVIDPHEIVAGFPHDVDDGFLLFPEPADFRRQEFPAELSPARTPEAFQFSERLRLDSSVKHLVQSAPVHIPVPENRAPENDLFQVRVQRILIRNFPAEYLFQGNPRGQRRCKTLLLRPVRGDHGQILFPGISGVRFQPPENHITRHMPVLREQFFHDPLFLFDKDQFTTGDPFLSAVLFPFLRKLDADPVELIQDHVLLIQERPARKHLFARQERAVAGQTFDIGLRGCLQIHPLREVPRHDRILPLCSVLNPRPERTVPPLTQRADIAWNNKPAQIRDLRPVQTQGTVVFRLVVQNGQQIPHLHPVRNLRVMADPLQRKESVGTD